MSASFVTIGHSSRDLDTFLGMLRAAQVDLLIDVRAFPRSRANPVFNIERLPDALAPYQIGYQHWPELGGRRHVQSGIDAGTNALWRVQSFHNYADYALSDIFTAALGRLEQLGQAQRLALMCSEAVWWRCHRRIITDYLLLRGHAVDHLMGPGQVDAARPTSGAKKTPLGTIVYPASQLSLPGC